MIIIGAYAGTNWDLRGQFTHIEMADEVLLLVAEVERLREQLRLAKEWVANEHLSCLSTMDIFTEYIGGEEK